MLNEDAISRKKLLDDIEDLYCKNCEKHADGLCGSCYLDGVKALIAIEPCANEMPVSVEVLERHETVK